MKLAPHLVILAAFSLVPVIHADDSLPPEQHIAAIEQKYVSGDRQGAEREVEAWKKADKKSAHPWIAAADLSFQQKKYRRCRSQAANALDLAPQNADGYYWRGRCFEAEGKTLDAANEYRAALKAETAHPRAQEGLARIEGNTDGSNPLPKAN